MADKDDGHPRITEDDPDNKEIRLLEVWDSLAKNYSMIEGAQLSNSFVILISLNESRKSLLTTSQISEIISKRSKGRIFKNPATLKDALDKRLKREGYVNSLAAENKTLYSITPKGIKLLKGWISFLSAYS